MSEKDINVDVQAEKGKEESVGKESEQIDRGSQPEQIHQEEVLPNTQSENQPQSPQNTLPQKDPELASQPNFSVDLSKVDYSDMSKIDVGHSKTESNVSYEYNFQQIPIEEFGDSVFGRSVREGGGEDVQYEGVEYKTEFRMKMKKGSMKGEEGEVVGPEASEVLQNKQVVEQREGKEQKLKEKKVWKSEIVASNSEEVVVDQNVSKSSIMPKVNQELDVAKEEVMKTEQQDEKQENKEEDEQDGKEMEQQNGGEESQKVEEGEEKVEETEKNINTEELVEKYKQNEEQKGEENAKGDIDEKSQEIKEAEKVIEEKGQIQKQQQQNEKEIDHSQVEQSKREITHNTPIMPEKNQQAEIKQDGKPKKESSSSKIEEYMVKTKMSQPKEEKEEEKFFKMYQYVEPKQQQKQGQEQKQEEQKVLVLQNYVEPKEKQSEDADDVKKEEQIPKVEEQQVKQEVKEEIQSEKQKKPKKKKKKRTNQDKQQPKPPLKAEEPPPPPAEPQIEPEPAPNNEQRNEDQDENNSDKAPEDNRDSKPDKAQIPTNISLVNPISEIQHKLQQSVVEQKKDEAPLTSQIIVGQAYKERMGSTYMVFLKYVDNYTKALNYYKKIVQNVTLEISRRKNEKKKLQAVLLAYFNGYAKLHSEYFQKTTKINQREQQMAPSTNPYANISIQLKHGIESLTATRNVVSTNYNNMSTYTMNNIIVGINRVFSKYFTTIEQQEARQEELRNLQVGREKNLFKIVARVEKMFKKGLKGKFKVDILNQLAAFVNEETTHRQYLISYGKGLIPLRHTLISAQKELFDQLQPILNDFKTRSKVIYSVGFRQFQLIEDLTVPIKFVTKFDELAPLTDIDYIRYVLQIQQKKQSKQFTTRNFQNYLDLIFLDKLVGNIRDVYKGAICKIFPMSIEHEQLIHTISGRMVYFNRNTDQCLNTFVMRNTSARMLTEGLVEFDEVVKGIIFDDNRTVRVKMIDEDRAEELICYLNQKGEDFIVEEPSSFGK